MAKKEPIELDDDWISKSQLKREADELKDLGRILVDMNKTKLATIPISEELSEGIALAKRLKDKREALRRHYNYLGKVLRNENLEGIREALERLENRHLHEAKAQQDLEKLCLRLVHEGDTLAQELIDQEPSLERQKLRQLIRQAKKMHQEDAATPSKAAVELARYLKPFKLA